MEQEKIRLQDPLLKSCDEPSDAMQQRRSTQAITHRGDQTKYPENTMLAFEAAFEAGSDAIETDLHLTRDGVVVMSHDATLKRCFGVEKKIIDCDYSYIQTLRTLKEPHLPLPSLKEVVEYVRDKDIWLLLDIKVDNVADDVMRLTAETIKSVHDGGAEYWREKIVLGCWTLKFLPLCEKYLPGFPIVHIGFSTTYAREFLEHTNVGFNLFWPILQTTAGKDLAKEAKDAGRKVYVWTVNEEETMKWAIENDSIDGVCTDDPVKFLELTDGYGEIWLDAPRSMQVACYTFVWNWIATVVFIIYQWRYGKNLAGLGVIS
ncbi:PLC-like phosphodiesterase [Tricharina praecox]|uniref:PLC-like phosphodiesterase n=1 Tax=Tricharina praecox TaxID=43433 RepID=UPI0022210FEC|nr:PLC-like phosphodiesterase [Tricharina praecox]KAI5853902.1 PLC-like phosphodiesterase [Tricharina praecox]